MNDINVKATEWTIEADGIVQKITLETNAYKPYKVRTVAKPWTQWSGHLNHGSQVGDRTTPRKIVQCFDSLEEAMKFATDLLAAELKLKQAQRDLDEVTKTMVAGS